METEKKRTLKGSILFTVVSVLSLMIIFMTSALALAAAANKRAHKTYSASQASYTARSAIDSILAAIGTNNEFANAVENLPQNGKFEVEIGINSPSLGKIDTASVEYAGKTTIFDPNAKTWVEKNLIKITAEVTMGGETTKLVSHVIQDPVVKSDDGPGFLTMGDSDSSNHGTQWGGSYYGMGYGVPYPSPLSHEETVTEYVKLHDGYWDPFRGPWGEWVPEEYGEVTKTITVYDTNEKWNSGLTYIFWNEYDNKLTTLEDKQYLTNKNFNFQNDNIIEAPLVKNGNLTANTSVDIYYTQLGKGMQIWGNLDISNTDFNVNVSSDLKDHIAASSKKFNQVPYLYVDQKFSTSQSIKIGDGSFPFNIFCGSFDFTENGPSIYADIYCMDKEATSHYSSTASTLYKWADSLLNGGSGYTSAGGNIYSKGSLSFDTKGATVAVQGSVKAERNVDINRPVTILGDLVVGGKLSIGTGDLTVYGNIYAGSCEGTNVSIVGAGELKDGYNIADVNYVIGKDVFVGADVDTAIHYPYIWLDPEALKEYDGYYDSIADSNAFDFKNLMIDPKYLPEDFNAVEGLEAPADWGQPDGPGYDAEHPETPLEFVPDLTQVRKCRDGYFNAEGKEVLETEAVSTGGIKYGTKDVYPLAEYYEKASSIYPEYADKAVILGLSGPVKGTEGHFGQDTPQACYDKVYNGTSQLVGHVTESCTLTGLFTKKVTIDANGEVVYVLIKDATFQNNEDPSEARIVVNESNGGRVFFTFAGAVECFYDNPVEKEDSQVVQTVFEVMDTWNIENNINSPAGEIVNEIHNGVPVGNISGVTVNHKEITISGVDVKLTGNFDMDTTIKIIPPATGSMWVQLDSTSFQTPNSNKGKIIIEDVGADGSKIGGTVNFYITGSVAWKKWHLVTRSFLNAYDSGKTYQILSDPKNSYIKKEGVELLPAPNVNIYSSKNAVLDCGHGSTFFTAYFRAPFLTMDGKTEAGEYDSILSRLYYDGVLLSDTGFSQMGVIGCLNVKKYSGQNNWSLLYIKNSEGGDAILDASKQHTYAAVSYLDY